MSIIRQIDNPAETAPGIPDEALGPDEEAAFEAELEQAEAEEKKDRRAEEVFGEHPGGIGQTLGGDLEAPNPGQDIGDFEDDDH